LSGREKDGDLVEVDADKGIVTVVKKYVGKKGNKFNKGMSPNPKLSQK